jgi:hypothetical protein
VPCAASRAHPPAQADLLAVREPLKAHNGVRDPLNVPAFIGFVY